MNDGNATAKDVAVVGAGVAGVCCAVALVHNGHRVTLIDRQGPGEGACRIPLGLLVMFFEVPWVRERWRRARSWWKAWRARNGTGGTPSL